MKPDGVTMDTTEPTEVAAVAEPSMLQEDVTEQAPSQPGEMANNTTHGAAPKANGKPPAADPKVKPKAVGSKARAAASTGVSGSSSRPGTATHRTANDVKSGVAAPAGKRAATNATSKASAAGAVPKRPAGVAAGSSTTKNQTRVPDKRPVGLARTASAPAATATNGTKPSAVNGTSKKRPATETDNGARPKTTAVASRMVASTVSKPSSSTTTKPAAAATSKTTRPATGSSTSRATSTTSRPATAATKPSTAKAVAPRAATAPSAGRTAVTQSPKPAAAAKKDVSRPPSAAVPKKPAAATGSPAAKKHEPSKAVATVRLNSAPKGSTATKVADAKTSQSKPQQPAKPTPTKKPASSVRMPPATKPPLGRTPPSSPANKPANSSASNVKRGTKPTQTVPPFTATKKTEVSNAALPTAAALGVASAVTAAATKAVGAAETLSEATVAGLQESSLPSPALEEVPTHTSSQHTTTEVKPGEVDQSTEAVPSPLQSPVKTTSPQTSLPVEQLENGTPSSAVQEQISLPAKSTLPPFISPTDLPGETAYALSDKTPTTSTAFPSAANAVPPVVPSTNLNEVEDEEEKEGSQLVSVSEMSGTTQPTEESRPESCGQVGGSAWRAGGALLSELDSEEVSVSQQGASELSAPGVLEGTESMDDLGDGSLKGAIDMEGASAGSPDFEKVPDIPVNDFDEDEDDSDRVCDMDVGSERTDELRRLRHDNDMDEEEDDDDVEMASEGVTESGLESYGNADEDDFAEDDRLDNLNRVVQPPPPPALPSAPAAQWDQPNPFMDPWAEPLQPQQVLQPAQVAGAAAARPMADPWQLDLETPAQAWFELGSVPEKQDAPHHSFVKTEPQNSESSQAPVQTLAPAPPSAPGMSQSSTLSSEASSPEEQGHYDDTKFQGQVAQALVPSPQADPDSQGLGEEDEEAEPETLPADEVLGGPSTAPTSNPSSSSVTEDEASDTEGEAQLEDSLESPVLGNITFVSQAAPQRCLSTVEEGEEAETVEGGAVEDTTPPSATSLASYGFDTVTTTSNSNAQSAGESCIKSPGIFSLEELPEEAKDPHAQQCLTEQQYIECGKQELESAEHVGKEVLVSEKELDHSSPLNAEQQPEETPDDIQPPYYSAICEKTEDSFAGFAAALHPHRRDHSAYPRAYYDIVKLPGAAVTPPRLTCADLPPRRSPGQQELSPQLRRLEQHQRQLQELQQRREQQSRPLEEAEQERKRRVEEEERRKKEEAEEEIKRNKEEEERKMKEEEELKQRRDLELQLQQQQQELKQRQQIMQWQQELQQSNKAQAVLLSPSSGLCTIYEALENSEEEAEGEENEQDSTIDKEPQQHADQQVCDSRERLRSDEDKQEDSSLSASPSPLPDSTQSSSSQDEDNSSSCPPESPERPLPVDLDWGKKVDIVQQLINQTLMLNGDGCSSLLLLPGGAGGTLSPLESSLWPSLLPPLTPPSATVTSVSSFSPEASGSSSQGEWTVVELETHH